MAVTRSKTRRLNNARQARRQTTALYNAGMVHAVHAPIAAQFRAAHKEHKALNRGGNIGAFYKNLKRYHRKIATGSVVDAVIEMIPFQGALSQ